MIFRQESITIIQIKEFICATMNIFIIQYINYLYLNLFTAEKYKDLATREEKIKVIEESLA